MARSKANKEDNNNRAPLPPGVERRRMLRKERRREQLIQSWRILLFGGVSSGLIWLLLSAG